MDIWPWIFSIPSSPPYLLLSSSPITKTKLLMSHDASSPSPSSDGHHTISLCVASSSLPPETLWTSDPFPSGDPAPSLLLQLLRELPALAAPGPPPPWPPDPPALMASDELPNLLALLLLARFFWPCAFHPFPDVGALYFSLLASALPAALACRAALRDLLLHAGPDLELLLARALTYALSKLCCLRDLSRAQFPAACSLSYAADVHGLWILRGYAPVAGMPIAHRQGAADLEARDPAVRYALAHQILEAVLQFEYEVRSGDERYLEVAVRVDNLRVRVSRLRIGAADAAEEEEEGAERHFPSRVRVLVAPDAAARGVAGLSLGRSTGNPWREVERGQRVRGRFGGKGGREVEAEARAAWRARSRGWRWEQEAEGNAAVFEGVLCDATSGEEVAGWRGGAAADPRRGMRGRCRGAARALGKSGGVVVAADEFGEWVRWRVGRGDEGREIAWRIAGKVWISYCANEVSSTSYFETRFVEWEDVVRLRLRSTGS